LFLAIAIAPLGTSCVTVDPAAKKTLSSILIGAIKLTLHPTKTSSPITV